MTAQRCRYHALFFFAAVVGAVFFSFQFTPLEAECPAASRGDEPRWKQGFQRGECRATLMNAGFSAMREFLTGFTARADTLDELKREMEIKSEEIRRLEEEAKKYRGEIASKQATARTLSGELARIDRTVKKLKNDISLTQRSIQKKQIEIKIAALDIEEKKASIETLRGGLAGILKAQEEADRQSVMAIILTRGALSDFFQQLDRAASAEDSMVQSLDELRAARRELEIGKSNAEKKKREMEDLKSSLAGRKKLEENESTDRAILLKETKNQEKQYALLLQEQEKKRAALEDEVRSIEEKIRITVDPSLLPRRGSGVLGWPLANLVLSQCITTFKQDAGTNCITQNFGYTSFAAVGAYQGKGHNGTDFRADVGAAVLAAENGEIAGVGDTDIGCRGASYGKWILIKHPNNLSTLYAHLSEIAVSAGQSVQRGEQIGYAGRSGYATGPHLHFSVFAAQAVRIDSIVSRVCGRTMILPLSAVNGYLNPLDYL